MDAPANRHYTDWGLYPNQPYVIGPPWSEMVAYDLNKGTIKWRVPLGEDARATAEGATNTGVFMAERHGIIVTSTGLHFVATTDGKVAPMMRKPAEFSGQERCLRVQKGCPRCTK